MLYENQPAFRSFQRNLLLGKVIHITSTRMPPNDPLFSSTESTGHNAIGHTSLSSRVAQALMQKIRGGELAPGARLPSEQAMSEHFAVSRTVIREAIASLKAEGLVETRQGSGGFVRGSGIAHAFQVDAFTEHSVQTLLNVIEVRRGIEAETAALAAFRRTPEQLAEIGRALAQIDKAVAAGSNGVEEDVHFHLSIAKATGNPYWIKLVELYASQIRAGVKVTRANETRRVDFTQQVRVEHKEIVAAIADADPVRARVAAASHMEHAAQRVRAADRDFWQGEGGALASHLGKGYNTKPMTMNPLAPDANADSGTMQSTKLSSVKTVGLKLRDRASRNASPRERKGRRPKDT